MGDELVIVGQAADSLMANDLFKVRGILKSVGEEIDHGGFFMLDTSFRNFMGLPEGIHEVFIKRHEPRQAIDYARQKVANMFPQYEVKHWR